MWLDLQLDRRSSQSSVGSPLLGDIRPNPNTFSAALNRQKVNIAVLKSEIKTWLLLSGWLICCCCENPKANVKTISLISWKYGLVVALVHCLSEVSQREGARWNTVDLCPYFGICCSPATIATSLVTEVGMAGKAAGGKWMLRVGEQPPATSRGVSRGLKQGGLTLAEELD